MRDQTPEHWDSFLRIYGHAVYTAHLFEKHLASLMWFLEARKRDILRRPTPAELVVLIDELDGNPLGGLIDKLREYHINHEVMELFGRANANRIDLVHHFTVKFADVVADGSRLGRGRLAGQGAKRTHPVSTVRGAISRESRDHADAGSH